ncbi:hypothetical protein [Flavobacterium ajazii]|uniref:hypothetical protein n=1 Tax=Flavobacterium ajazii TaxID=2692318 RepID=UPI0013D6C9DA|nr:hypothetical protein [Flavobacterium ajazii]
MKEQHKELIELIISEFKKSENRVMYRQDLDEFFPDSDTKGTIFNIILKNLKLIEPVIGENYNYTLTKEGYNFTSFKDIESKELALKLKEDAELENIITSTKVNKWLLKTKWYPLVISIIAVLVSIYFGYKDSTKNNELEQRIINLEEKSKSLKNDAKPLKIYPKEVVEKVTAKKIDTLKKTLKKTLP